MSHKNKDTSSLPKVFQRLGSSTSSHRNTRQPDSRRAPSYRFDSSSSSSSSTVDSSSYTLPNYSAISRMDNDVLHYSSSAQSNNSTFQPQPQQQQQQQQVVSNAGPPPVQNVFNFVKKGQPQEQTGIPISFVNPTTANNSMNSNIPNRGGISFVNNSNSYNHAQPMHHFQPVQNETPMLPQPQQQLQQQHQHQHQNHQHQQQQYQHQNHQQHQPEYQHRHQQWVGNDIVKNNDNTNSFSTSKKEDRIDKSSNDIAKEIKIVASVPNDSDSDSGDDNTSRGSTDRKRTKSSRKVIYQSSSKRARSTSRERSPVSNRKETSPSSRKRRSSDDRASSSRSAASTSSKARVRRRPRRRTPPNHDDSDDMLAPFFDLKGDFYIPDYYTDSSDGESEEERDINSRLSKRNLSIERKKLEEPEATTTTTTTTTTTEKPVHKTSAASILASGPLPPSKKFTAPNASSSPATSPTIASSNPPLPLSKKFTPANAASVVMTPSGPLPLSRKFTAPATTVQTASGPLPLSKKFTPPAASTNSGTNRTTSDSSPVIQAKKTVTPISHKIITASNTIVPPNSSLVKNKNGATSVGKTSERKTSDADKTTTKVNTAAAAAAAAASTNTTANTAGASRATIVSNNDNTLSPIEKNGLETNTSSAGVTTSASAVKNGTNQPSGELLVSKSDTALSLDKDVVNNDTSAPTTENTAQIENNSNVAPDKNGSATYDITSKAIKGEMSKDLSSQMDIDARDDVVMDAVLPSLHTNPKTTTTTTDSNNKTGRNSDNITLTSKNRNPQEAAKISKVKQEPVIPQLKIEALKGDHVVKNIVSFEKELPQVVQQAWESITQSPICHNDGSMAQDENSSTSTSPTTTNSVAETDSMDVEPTSFETSPPPPPPATPTDAIHTQQLPAKPSTTTTTTTDTTSALGKRKQRKPGVPAPWKVRIGDDFEIYYQNTVTGEITVDRPV